MPGNDFRLITLGRTALLTPDGQPEGSLGRRRRKLALLAYIALARRPLQRAELIEVFWGGQLEERARHSLVDALSHIRRVLGPHALSTRRSEIALAPGTPLVVDAGELVAGAARGAYRDVVELYRGAFLAGVEVPDSPAFDRWLLRERERLRGLYVEACELSCVELAREERWPAAAETARGWLDADPLSADAALTLLGALRADGTRAGHRRALSEYRQLALLLSREFDWEPADAVSALATQIAGELEGLPGPDLPRAGPGGPPPVGPDGPAPVPVGPLGPEPPPDAPRTATTSDPPAVAPAPPPARRTGGRPARWRKLAAATLLPLSLLGGFLGLRRLRPPPGAPAGPTLAVLDVRELTNAAGDRWLEEGLPQMIGSALFQAGNLDVVPPERVRDLLRRSQEDRSGLSEAQALDLGRRLGAGLVVRGGFSHGAGTYVLDLRLEQVQGGRMLDAVRLSDPELLPLADDAAAWLAGAVGGDGDRPGLAGVRTRSLAAYGDYVRALQAQDAGRLDEAVDDVEQALREDSGFVAALRLRGDLAGEQGDPAAADEALRRIARFPGRASPFDRLDAAIQVALDAGEREQPEALARELVRRYPRDPRAYGRLAGILFTHGDFAGQEHVLRQELALDSLGMEAGRGPCLPCSAYGGLAGVRTLRGDMPGAAAAARRWVQLEPDLPAAWAALGSALSMAGDFAGAMAVQRRAVALDPSLLEKTFLARIELMAGRFQPVDSLLSAWRRAPSPETGALALDLRVTLARERGRYRAAERALEQAAPGEVGGLELVEANTLARLGDQAAADRIYERSGHPAAGTNAERARAFCWAHALEAEDRADRPGGTATLAALADSVERAAEHSYYARDWRLAHHIRGLLALRAGRYDEAVRELSAARFGVAGWTATDVHLAAAQLALHRPSAAVRTLRQALMGPLDAMGRYVPRTEIEYRLARAFQAAGEPDSARIYAGRVRRAWAVADPAVRARLAQLPPG